MNSLPPPVLQTIFSFLHLTELLLFLRGVCKRFDANICQSAFLGNQVQVQFKLCSPVNLELAGVIKLLKALRQSPRRLEFVGFSTDGGLAEDDVSFWCSNMFLPSRRPYSAKEQCSNVNVAAVLCRATPQLLTADEEALLRKHTFRRLRVNFLSVFRQHRFRSPLEVCTYFLGQADISALPDAQAVEAALEQLMQRYKATTLRLPECKRIPDNNLILDTEVDLEATDTSPHYALVTKLVISRSGPLTCPVVSLCVFASEEYIDVTDPRLESYNNMISLDALIQAGFTPKAMNTMRGCMYAEFQCEPDKFKPLLWVRFTAQPRASEMKLHLAEPVFAKYLYVKLIESEDRRRAVGFMHLLLNIDCQSVIPFGQVVKLR